MVASPNCPKMLLFLSSKYKYKYKWDKFNYASVTIVYVSFYYLYSTVVDSSS